VTLKKRASLNTYGETATVSNVRVVNAYIEPADSIDRSTQTSDENYPTRVIVQDVSVNPEDTIVLPDGKERIIRNVERYDFWADLEHSVLSIA
jgi:hypothetical protein